MATGKPKAKMWRHGYSLTVPFNLLVDSYTAIAVFLEPNVVNSRTRIIAFKYAEEPFKADTWPYFGFMLA